MSEFELQTAQLAILRTLLVTNGLQLYMLLVRQGVPELERRELVLCFKASITEAWHPSESWGQLRKGYSLLFLLLVGSRRFGLFFGLRCEKPRLVFALWRCGGQRVTLVSWCFCRLPLFFAHL